MSGERTADLPPKLSETNSARFPKAPIKPVNAAKANPVRSGDGHMRRAQKPAPNAIGRKPSVKRTWFCPGGADSAAALLIAAQLPNRPIARSAKASQRGGMHHIRKTRTANHELCCLSTFRCLIQESKRAAGLQKRNNHPPGLTGA